MLAHPIELTVDYPADPDWRGSKDTSQFCLTFPQSRFGMFLLGNIIYNAMNLPEKPVPILSHFAVDR
jgi:hypothetical protein